MEYLRGALILSISSIVSCENFMSVLTSCRYWDVLNVTCDVGNRRFHCILDQDNVPGIVYTKWTTLPSGYCPIYNRYAKHIDGRPCNISIGDCPTKLIRSYEAVGFTGCFQMPPAKPSLMNTEKSTDVPESDKKDIVSAAEKCDDSRDITITFMALAIPFTSVTLGISFVYCYKRHNRRHKPTGRDDNTKSLINIETHTSERETTSGSSLNIVYHRQIKRHSSENWANTAISRSSSEPNLDAIRCALYKEPLVIRKPGVVCWKSRVS